MHIPTVSSFLALFLTPHVFQSSLSIVESEGHIPFTVDGDVYQTYFKIFGDIGHRTRTPVVIVHGGPGLSHDYLLPHADLANHSYPVIFYDQIGNARSTHLPNKPPAFWSIDLFLDELDNLLRYFGIQDEFHIVGHSWGGMMAAEYVLRRHPAGLQRLVIADSPPDIGLWRQSFKELLKEFPQSVQDAIMRGPDKDLEAYYDAVKQFYTVHGCRVRPWPDELARSMEFEYGEDGDRTVARANILDGWSIVDQLHAVDVPTLTTNGRYDIAQDYVVRAYHENIPGAKWVRFENSSHMPFWEERARYMEVLRRFLESDLDV